MLAEARALEDEVDPADDLDDGADNVIAGARARGDSSVELGEFAS